MITENMSIWVLCNNHTDDSEAGKYQNVYFRVTEESKNVLEKNWVATTYNGEESCIKMTICQ